MQRKRCWLYQTEIILRFSTSTTTTFKVSTLLLHWSCLLTLRPEDMHDKNWAWTNYLSARALAQADNVRAQLQRTMERFEVELVSIQDERKLWPAVRQALVCGFFMQVAHKQHKEGEKGTYLTVKDNQVSSTHFKIVTWWLTVYHQVVALHPSCGLDTQPEWVMFNEFVLTSRPYIRTVTDVRPEWFVHLFLLFIRICSTAIPGFWNTPPATSTWPLSRRARRNSRCNWSLKSLQVRLLVGLTMTDGRPKDRKRTNRAWCLMCRFRCCLDEKQL